jgi:hypothetical protein
MFRTSPQIYSIGLIFCIFALVFLRYVYLNTLVKEGFQDDTEESRYTAIKASLKTSMGPYCQMTTFAHNYMKKIFTMKASPSDMIKPAKPIPDDYAPAEKAAALKAQASASEKAATVGPPAETPEQAEKHILQIYKKVYTCRDDMASSRASCKPVILARALNKETADESEEFIPCSTYLNLPRWTPDDTVTPSASLMLIPNNLAAHLTKELDWLEAMMTKLSNAADMVKSPPSTPPDTSETPDSDASGKSYSADGFADMGKCSPSDIQGQIALMRKKKLEQKQSSCSIPPLNTELTRVEKLLNSADLKAVLARCGPMLTRMTALKELVDKLEKGTDVNVTKKDYKQFSATNRADALVFSIKQNQS